MKILLTGGTGFIGSFLSNELTSLGYEFIIVSRKKRENKKNISYINWDSQKLIDSINHADIVINLAGEPIVGKRWTKEQKDLLYKSRIETTRLISTAINKATKKPKKLISGSAIGIYGDRGNEILNEDSKAGNGFLVDLCKDWEKEAKAATTNVTILRTGIVLGNGGGVLEKMLPIFKMGLGGPLGSGNQWMSWISIYDVVGIIKFVIENENVNGILNMTAPNPVTNKEFSNVLGKVLHRPSFISVPALALKMLLGEMSEVLLGGQKAIPEKITGFGYKFKHPELKEALERAL